MGSSVAALPRHTAPNRGRRLTAARKVARDRLVVADRLRGCTWSQISQRRGISERQGRNILAQWREAEKETLFTCDPLAWLVDTLGRLDSIIGTLAEVAEQADNDAARVGALRSQMSAIQQQAALLVASGLLPRDLRSFAAELKALPMVQAMVDVIERHNVGRPVLDDLVAVIEGSENGWRNGRALVSCGGATISR